MCLQETGLLAQKFLTFFRFKGRHNWDVYDHSRRKIIFDSMMNKIFIWAPKINDENGYILDLDVLIISNNLHLSYPRRSGYRANCVCFRSTYLSSHCSFSWWDDLLELQTTRRETWLSKALNPASLLPGIIIGFLVGLWVELPKGGFSRGSSREDPDQPERQRKGSVGGRNQGRQGSATLTNAAAASDEGGELKMVREILS